MTSQRRLTAIMFTDIVGYSKIIKSGEGSANDIRTRYYDILTQHHAQHQGNLIQFYGDGSLSLFESPVQAVECAIHMQQLFQQSRLTPVRIGIHFGEIVREEEEVYGDAVQLASHIESLGISGSVLVSGEIYTAIKNQKEICLEALGSFEFKNINRSHVIYAVCNRGIVIPNRATLGRQLKGKRRSVAVLPFINTSDDSAYEYLCQGASEELTHGLGIVDGLKVSGRHSAMVASKMNLAVENVGSYLGVSNLLEGSIKVENKTVIISIRLVKCIDGYLFFSGNFSSHTDDFFALLNTIAHKVSRRLRRGLGDSQHADVLVKNHTQRMDAYKAYLKGLFYMNHWDNQAMSQAMSFFNEALSLDPAFGLPHAQLGLCYFFKAYSGQLSWKEAQHITMSHIEKTKKIGLETPEAYFGLGIYEVVAHWNWQGSSEIIAEGLSRFPNYPSLHHLQSTLHYITGDMESVIAAIADGHELDPFSIEMNLYLGKAYVWNREYDKALPLLDLVLHVLPKHRAAREFKGWALALQGKYNEAYTLFDTLSPEAGYRLHRQTCLGWLYIRTGELEKAQACIHTLTGLEESSSHFSYDLAVLFTAMGDYDRAFLYMEKALKNRVGDSMLMVSDIFISPLRSDPRFSELFVWVGDVPWFEYY